MDIFDLSAKIRLNTKDYEDGIKKAKNENKNLGDSFKSAVANSETLSNKLEVLKGKYSETQKRVKSLTEEFNKSVKETGATSDESIKLAKELDKAEKEAKDLEKGMDELNQEIKDLGENSNKSSGNLEKLGNGLKNGLANAAKIGAAAVGVAATAIGALVTQSVKAYAEYEQLVGGVDTLFKESSDTVQQYAENAYKTAGLSANEYMSTVTGFSASLLQSLGGDTEKAAEYADQAVIDMSDNANKMGTSMEMIQNAYQGFAKQNYTMLDNLNTMGALVA